DPNLTGDGGNTCRPRVVMMRCHCPPDAVIDSTLKRRRFRVCPQCCPHPFVTLWTPGSAIGVPRSATTLHAPRTAAPRRPAGTEHGDRGDHPFAHLLGQATVQLRGEQTDLGGPGGGVGAHHQNSVLERLRHAVVGDLVTHDLPPPADNPADGPRLPPPELAGQSVHGVPERRRVSGGGRCAGQVPVLGPTAGLAPGGGHPLGPGCFSCPRQRGARCAVRVAG